MATHPAALLATVAHAQQQVTSRGMSHAIKPACKRAAAGRRPPPPPLPPPTPCADYAVLARHPSTCCSWPS